jgi:hypothetical protein
MPRRKIKGQFCEKTLAPKTAFDKRSFRYKKSGKSWLLVGCPTGKWNAKTNYCRVGTRAHKLLAARRGTSCPTNAKRVVK